MPGEKRRIHPSLIERLRDEPYRFEFFQAVRLLLAHHRTHSSESDPDALGQTIRFRSSISLAFPPSEIESLDFEWLDGQEADVRKNGTSYSDERRCFKRVTITPAFIGLTGPSGVLPRHYTQHAAERETRYRDSSTRAFFDIFTTRAVSLFYQSWLKYRIHLQYETDRKNRFLPLVLSLAGLGLPGNSSRLKTGRDGISDESLAFYAAGFRQRPQSADWFARIASDYFRVRCRIEQFIGRWFELPIPERTRLGAANCVLGQTSFCGARVWDRQSKIRLTVGPMRRKEFNDFLPGESAYESLHRLFRLMLGPTFDCEVRLVLDGRDVASARLSAQYGNTPLGWNSRLRSPGSSPDSLDTTYLFKATDPI